MERNPAPILSLESLCIGYSSGKERHQLLSPLIATALKGELIAVIGRNGIGKSTLLRTITGLQPPLDGHIRFSGKDIADHSRLELAQKIGFISTEIVKAGNMSVYEMVSLGRYPYTNWLGRTNVTDHEIIIDAIEKTGIQDLYGRNISELSDGERQRAMIARVLAQDTEIVIMDEPTAFLDIKSKYEIVHLLHELAGKKGKTIIFSTHDLSIALSHADKIWLTLEDRLTEGAPEDLLREGAFEHLFDSSVIKFNSHDGSFSFRKEERGYVFVEGNGQERLWTEKAVIRAGFSLAEKPGDLIIRVPVDSSVKWIVTKSYGSLEFRSILELVRWLCSGEGSF